MSSDEATHADAKSHTPPPGIDESRRAHFLRATIIGLVVGVVAVSFQRSLTAAEHLRQHLIDLVRSAGPMAVVALGALIVALIAFVGHWTSKLCPEAAGSGIPHVKGLLITHERMRGVRVILTKFIGGVLGIGAGLSLGREGPTIQLGAATGSLIADGLNVKTSAYTRMITCGAGAGLAAAFNAPLAGFVFVIEELRREVSTRTYGSGLIACLVADIVSRLLNGQLPVFHVKNLPLPPLTILPWAFVLGITAALIGIVFARGILAARRAAASKKLGPPWRKSAVIGLAVALAAFLLPAAAGGGHATAERILEHGYAGAAAKTLALILCAKLFLTVLSYATGAPGGFFMPLLVLGAGTGALFGEWAGHLSADVARYPESFAVIGMAAIFSGVVRAPLTGIVLIVEMTGSYEMTFAVSVASLAAYLLSERFGPPPIYEALLHAAESPEGASAHSEPVIIHRVIESGAELDGRTLAEADLPDGCLVITVHRAGRAFVPDGRTRLISGDDIAISALPQTAKDWKRIDKKVRAAD